MESILTPLNFNPYIEWPGNLIEWASLLVLFACLCWAVARYFGKQAVFTMRQWIFLGGLVAAALVTSLIIGISLPANSALPRALLPEEPRGPSILFLSALPWMLAAGFLGPLAGAAAGLAAGLTRAAFESHSLFTMIQTAGMAFCFGVLVHQSYRTPTYRLLRHPMPASIAVTIILIPLLFLFAILQSSGAVIQRVDYAIARLPASAAAAAVELILGGLIVQGIALIFRQYWGSQDPLVPSPSESSLQLRFFYATGPFIVFLLAALVAGDWFLADRAARIMLEDRLGSSARMVADSLPSFFEAGQTLIVEAAAGIQAAATPAEQIPDSLSRSMRVVPFFRQLYLFDSRGIPVNGYPETDAARLSLTGEEQAGIRLAMAGVNVQSYSGGYIQGEKTAMVSFLAAVPGSDGQIAGVLLGRTDLASNPYTKPLISSLEEMSTSKTLGVSSTGSYGMIIDENSRVLYHPLPSRVMTTYQSQDATRSGFFDKPGPDGTRSLVYYQPVPGKAWTVLLSVPASQVQQLALSIAMPLLLMILLTAAAALLALRLSLRGMTSSLKALESEASRIAKGQLDHAISPSGVDEVGRLSLAFEQMRKALKTQVDELNRLLDVSQGVASNLDMADAVQPILDAAINTGASSARVVLYPELGIAGGGDRPESYGSGASTDHFSYLDEQILNMVQAHEKLVLPNLTRGKGLNLHTAARPRAVIALNLRHENKVLGTLWMGYDVPHQFDDEEVRFLTTLAGEAAMAAANTRLYTQAEIGRQRVEAILEATPDPVLVTDPHNRLILINPAAQVLPGMVNIQAHGQPVESVLQHEELLNLFHQPGDNQQPHEFVLEDGKVYYATVSHLSIGDQPVGKVCILRDITHFKKMDTVKTEFVTTVSHDLRVPLSLVSGYATMVQMVGELNDQQKTYLRKITAGVDGMTRMVNNLLDLGRMDTGMALQVENIPVSDLLDRVVNSLQLQAAQKNIQINRAFSEGDNPIVCVDQALMHQALYNLLDNAIKFTPVGGQIDVEATMQHKGVIFSVADSGIGIAPLDQPRLFEKFYRGGQREAYQQRGTGLGLAIVKSVAERHGGRVWVESSLGKGSTFFLEVPYIQPSGATLEMQKDGTPNTASRF